MKNIVLGYYDKNDNFVEICKKERHNNINKNTKELKKNHKANSLTYKKVTHEK